MEHTFYKHVVTQTDKDNKYFTVPDNIIGVVDMFDIGDALSTNNLFNIRYQIALNDLYDLSRYELVPYYMNFQNIRMIEEILVGKQRLRYTRNTNQVHVDIDWDRLNVGDYIVAKAYKVIDPDSYADIWKDRWLLRYAACLIKLQWGTNLIKFEGMQLPGGVILNGRQIYDDATGEIEALRERIRMEHELPPDFFIG